MTFAQFLIAIEEMQTQQRAENGITEIVLGIIGETPFEQQEELTDLVALGTAFMDAGSVSELALNDLPDDVRSVFLAEKHRMESGAVLPSSFYKLDKDKVSDNG